MAWTGIQTFATSPIVAGAFALAAVGLLVSRTRRWAAVAILAVLAYTVSDWRLNGVLALDALWLVPVAAMALFVMWPRLIEVETRND